MSRNARFPSFNIERDIPGETEFELHAEERARLASIQADAI